MKGPGWNDKEEAAGENEEEPSKKLSRGERKRDTSCLPITAQITKNTPFVLWTSCPLLYMSPPGAPLSYLEVTFRH